VERNSPAEAMACAARPLAWGRRRCARLVAWGRRRLNPKIPHGFWLTFTVWVGALAASAFGVITYDVAGHHGVALLDPRVTAWVVDHRSGWLTGVMEVITWLGSAAVIVPMALITGILLVRRRRRWQPLAFLAAAVGGAIGLYNIVKHLVGRARPPAGIWIGHYSSASFPSGHATQSAAFYAALAIILGAGRSSRAKTVLWSVAALVTLAVGASRIYLGAHWLTDVLGGYALGTCWISVVVIVALTASSPGTGGAELHRRPGRPSDSGSIQILPSGRTPAALPSRAGTPAASSARPGHRDRRRDSCTILPAENGSCHGQPRSIRSAYVPGLKHSLGRD